MSWGQGFAEGDSGIVMTPAIAIWNEIEKDKATNSEVKWVSVSAAELYGKVIGLALSIAENSKNQNSDRVAALDVVRKAMLDYSLFTPTPEKDA